jgi:TIGR00730 family protein
MIGRRLYEYGKFLKSLTGTNLRLLWGMWRLTKLPQPAITVFGSSRLPLQTIHAERARALAKKLALGGFSIITGGGPGIMEAANRGAFEAAHGEHVQFPHSNNFSSFGIGLTRLNKEKSNPYVQDYIMMDHFFARKWLLVRYSVGFVVFPGGFGTMDELCEVLTLIQTNRMKKMPIVLMDKDYWEPFHRLIHEKMLANDLIAEKDDHIIDAITDDVDEAYEIIVKGCKCLGFNEK